MNKKVLIIYLLVIHAFILLVLFKSDFIDRAQNNLGFIKTQPELSKHYHDMLAYHKRMDGNIPNNAVIFIGDSLTQSLAVSSISPLGVNYGIGGDTSVGVLNRIGEYSSINRAKIVVIAIGANDLNRREPNDILNNFNKIINSIPQNIEILFNSVLPVNENFKQPQGRSNERIRQLNVGLNKLCSEYSNVHFVSISNLLTDKSGSLSNEYHVGDGVHLNNNGYNIWIGELKRIMEGLSKS